jgi:hypothetical protein
LISARTSAGSEARTSGDTRGGVSMLPQSIAKIAIWGYPGL